MYILGLGYQPLLNMSVCHAAYCLCESFSRRYIVYTVSFPVCYGTKSVLMIINYELIIEYIKN